MNSRKRKWNYWSLFEISNNQLNFDAILITQHIEISRWIFVLKLDYRPKLLFCLSVTVNTIIDMSIPFNKISPVIMFSSWSHKAVFSPSLRSEQLCFSDPIKRINSVNEVGEGWREKRTFNIISVLNWKNLERPVK